MAVNSASPCYCSSETLVSASGGCDRNAGQETHRLRDTDHLLRRPDRLVPGRRGAIPYPAHKLGAGCNNGMGVRTGFYRLARPAAVMLGRDTK